MKNVSKSKLSRMPLPQVSPADQRLFAERSSVVARARSAQGVAGQMEEELFASLQSRAFKGGL
ncbi:hypothetical protein [Janibacter sp. LM]|uniref:hypothetical protein n=1 Tax=Janibacter sp. LM TaxID=3144845 RepID=UPI0031F5FDEC